MFLSSGDRVASDHGPRQRTVINGASLHHGPMQEQTKTATYRNLCCTWYADYVAAWVTIVRVALLSKQALGVTVASTRTGDPGPTLCIPAMAGDHPQSRERAVDTSAGFPRRPADGPGVSTVPTGVFWCLRVTPESTSALVQFPRPPIGIGRRSS